jgi:hypothetical protein
MAMVPAARQRTSIPKRAGSTELLLQFRICIGDGKVRKFSRHLLRRTKEESSMRLAEHCRVIVGIA